MSGEPCEIARFGINPRICASHRKMIIEAMSLGCRLIRATESDAPAVRLEPQLMTRATPATVLLALERLQRPRAHEIREVDLPGWPRRGFVRDQTRCSCGWSGYFDIFPLHASPLPAAHL